VLADDFELAREEGLFAGEVEVFDAAALIKGVEHSGSVGGGDGFVESVAFVESDHGALCAGAEASDAFDADGFLEAAFFDFGFESFHDGGGIAADTAGFHADVEDVLVVAVLGLLFEDGTV